jgi:hypothetical protein
MKRHAQTILFIFSIVVCLSYYYSIFFHNFLGFFFESTTVGQDFFQIPSGVYAFLHHGSLTGKLPFGVASYIDCCGVDRNVYHPLFTFLIGYPLQLMHPWTAYAVWGIIHFLVTLFLVIFLWKKFPHHPYRKLALSFFLLNGYTFYELSKNQYQFLFNFFTILFLFYFLKTPSTTKSTLFYFLGLLVKPIGFLWFIPLLIYQKYKIAIWGVGLYILVSLPFFLSPIGSYFLSNFLDVAKSSNPSYNIFTLLPLFPGNEKIFLFIRLAIGGTLLILTGRKKLPLFTIIFLWTSYELTCYGLSFNYHYSIIAGMLCMGILLNTIPITKRSLFLCTMNTLPTPLFIFHLLGETKLSQIQNSLIILWSIFWLSCILVFLVIQKNQYKHYENRV